MIAVRLDIGNSQLYRVNPCDYRGVFCVKEARMDVLDGLVDEELRLELILVQALHEEAERLAAPTVR